MVAVPAGNKRRCNNGKEKEKPTEKPTEEPTEKPTEKTTKDEYDLPK